MGKPFKKELQLINEVLEWSEGIDTSSLSEFVSKKSAPFLIVGSGGSISAGYLLSSLLKSHGKTGQVVTPLELYNIRESIWKYQIVLISASGSNKDIIFAFQLALSCEPKSIGCLTMRANSPLSEEAKKYSICENFEFDVPTGKDGFLATNSLISTYKILLKSFEKWTIKTINFENKLNKIYSFVNEFININTIIVLYGKLGQPAAIDIESKCVEAGLMNIQLADFRNFGHGRHHWIAKHPHNVAIVALSSPNEKKICEKTLSLIPDNISKLVLDVETESYDAYLDFLILSFHLIDAIGDKVKIDPGKPGVPDFGSKLYHINLNSFFKIKKTTIKELAVYRKLKSANLVDNLEAKNTLSESYNSFMNKLQSTRYGSIVLDYDGTVCSKEMRFKELPEDISQMLNNFVENGFVLGIATGRGKSVQKTLQKAIKEHNWKRVIIGYYNGTLIVPLNDEIPKVTENIANSLIIIDKLINDSIFNSSERELRNSQLTIHTDTEEKNYELLKIINSYIVEEGITNLNVLSSGGSIDVTVRESGTKRNVINACKELSSKNGLHDNTLCIGDQGDYPGNDYLLLSTPYSLSVDKVSPSKNSCWNLATLGQVSDKALTEYLAYINYHSKYFQISIKK